ncbi:hypothetical protein N3K66_002771 [Trichothecium roseum]|uniref:Uncharacterized protein n=1 Tax=Trichothecium roseum TaxID=47278 RepID=A0ACC0VB42_9HYPO|nr:hypothetical protein N3K66_002771 [Trichothecium roseum]
MSSLSGSKVISSTPLPESEAKWIKTVKLEYKDPEGKTRIWESAERRTRPAASDIDGVGILAILPDRDNTSGVGPRVVLQKQFRPPVNMVTIEVPAGLVDAGETPEQAAVRELREETGYVVSPAAAATTANAASGEGEGTARPTTETSPVMYNDAGFCNTNLRMVHVELDPDLEENKNPRPTLEDGEFIETFTAPLARLWDVCVELEAEGYAIDARLGSLAEGILIAQRYKL